MRDYPDEDSSSNILNAASNTTSEARVLDDFTQGLQHHLWIAEANPNPRPRSPSVARTVVSTLAMPTGVKVKSPRSVSPLAQDGHPALIAVRSSIDQGSTPMERGKIPIPREKPLVRAASPKKPLPWLNKKEQPEVQPGVGTIPQPHGQVIIHDKSGPPKPLRIEVSKGPSFRAHGRSGHSAPTPLQTQLFPEDIDIDVPDLVCADSFDDYKGDRNPSLPQSTPNFPRLLLLHLRLLF